MRDVVDGLAEHLDQPPVAVPGELLVSGRAREAQYGLVVEPDVEDRVHHPGHRDRRAGANRDEERVGRVAEPLARAFLETFDVLRDLLVETFHGAARAHVGPARLGRDREAGRNRDAELRHLREPDPLAAEQVAPAVGRLVEVVDVAGHRAPDVVISRVFCSSAAPRPELRHPRERPQPDPKGREEYIEQDVREEEHHPPEGPVAERYGRLVRHRAVAFVSDCRSSSTRRTRCAVSSIDSSEMSMTGQPRRRCSFSACSSSS